MLTNIRLAIANSHCNENKQISFPGSLIPKDKPITVKIGKEFSKFLATIEALYSLAAEAIEKFNLSELKLFDSLATDCACHIRALHIVCLAKLAMADSTFKQELQENITALQAKRQLAKELSDSLGKMENAEKRKRFKDILGQFSKNPTISEILLKLNLATLVSAKVHFLIIAYLLTIVKDHKPITEADQINCLVSGTLLTKKDNVFKEVTNPKALSDRARQLINKEVTSSLLQDEVCALAKRLLLEASASFILKATARSCSVLQGYFLEENKKMVQGRIEFPDYYTLTAVFQNALYENIPVVLIIKKYQYLGHVYTETEAKSEIAMLLVPSQDRTYFQPRQSNSEDLLPHSPVMVVVAKAAYEDASTFLEKLMSNFNFMRLCQLDGVQHKQYTDSPLFQGASSAIPSLKLPKFQGEAEKLRKLQDEAFIEGFSIHSPNAQFILNHIFGDIMGNYYNSNYTTFFNEAAECFLRGGKAFVSKLKEASLLLTRQFQAADTRKFVTPCSFVVKPFKEYPFPRPTSTTIETDEEQRQKVKRCAFSQPDLPHTLRSNRYETEELQNIVRPAPMRVNHALHFLSKYQSLGEAQYSQYLDGRVSPILSDFLRTLPNPIIEAWLPFPMVLELGPSPSHETSQHV